MSESNGGSVLNVCGLCGVFIDNMQVCARCRSTTYCCRDHQIVHWKIHKQVCNPNGQRPEAATNKPNGTRDAAGVEPSGTCKDETCGHAHGHVNQNGDQDVTADSNIPRTDSGKLTELFSESAHIMDRQKNVNTDPKEIKNKRKRGAHKHGTGESEPARLVSERSSKTRVEDYILRWMNSCGICVLDNFMGLSVAESILQEVTQLEKSGVMNDGLLASKIHKDRKIRGDRITWVEKNHPGCVNITALISTVDNLLLSCNRRLGNYDLAGRTKAMVACYPGNGTCYMRHIDNPNNDGRCVTCIYYPNKDWDCQRDGGMLRIYPTEMNKVADVEPKMDRFIMFWSDRRNPHEVLPANRPRFALTLWYFDRTQREQAMAAYEESKKIDPELRKEFSMQDLESADTEKPSAAPPSKEEGAPVIEDELTD